MTDEIDAEIQDEAEQPPLTISPRSYCRGAIDGRPVLVCYDEATDETTVVAPDSKWYANALAALDIIEACTTKLPKSALGDGVNGHVLQVKRPGLIRAH